MISEKRLQPVRTIGFFCTVIVLKIFNLSHLLLDLAPSVGFSVASRQRAKLRVRGRCSEGAGARAGGSSIRARRQDCFAIAASRLFRVRCRRRVCSMSGKSGAGCDDPLRARVPVRRMRAAAGDVSDLSGTCQWYAARIFSGLAPSLMCVHVFLCTLSPPCTVLGHALSWLPYSLLYLPRVRNSVNECASHELTNALYRFRETVTRMQACTLLF